MLSEYERFICEHAHEAYPQECCGFLFGRDENGVRRIVRVEQRITVAEEPGGPTKESD